MSYTITDPHGVEEFERLFPDVYDGLIMRGEEPVEALYICASILFQELGLVDTPNSPS